MNKQYAEELLNKPRAILLKIENLVIEKDRLETMATHKTQYFDCSGNIAKGIRESRVEKYAISLAEIDTRISQMFDEYAKSFGELNRVLNVITEPDITEVLFYRYCKGMTVDKTAESANISKPTAIKRIRTGVEMVAKIMEEQNDK